MKKRLLVLIPIPWSFLILEAAAEQIWTADEYSWFESAFWFFSAIWFFVLCLDAALDLIEARKKMKEFKARATAKADVTRR